MPRTGKGGKREGAAQTAYSNRTDLNNRGPQPITVAPGQAYGEAKMQEDAQKAVPMGGTPVPAPAPGAPQNAPQAPQGPMPEPGSIPWTDHPSERPDEPVTAGLAVGPGAGPEVLHSPANQPVRLADILEGPASHPSASPQVQALAVIARQLGL